MMYKTSAQARRMFRALTLPDDLHRVLREPQYGCEAFVTLFLEECDAWVFDGSQHAVEMAQVAVELAERVEDCDPGRRESLKAMALMSLAGAYRQRRDLVAAERIFDRVFACPLDTLGNARRCCRLAILRIDQKRFDEAVTLAEEARRIYEEQGKPDRKGIALVYRGLACHERGQHEDAFTDLSEALALIDPREHPHAHYAAVHNLGLTLGVAAISLEETAQAMGYLKRAVRLVRKRSKSLPRLKLFWLEGLILTKLGLTRHAERVYKKAYRGFINADVPFEAALTALDLGALYHQEGAWPTLELLAAETYRVFAHSEHAATEAVAALALWLEAIRAEALTTATMWEVKETLQQQMR